MTNGTEAPPTVITQQLAAKTGMSEAQVQLMLNALFNAHDGILVNKLDESGPMRIMGVTVDLAER